MLKSDARLKERVEIARARLQTLEARYAKSARRLDTRRKIILGAMLIDGASRDPRLSDIVRDLVGRIERPHDRLAFQDWAPSEIDLGLEVVSRVVEAVTAPETEVFSSAPINIPAFPVFPRSLD
jgi:hypothetical protein